MNRQIIPSAARRERVSSTISWFLKSRLDSGSSSTRIRGSLASARAISTICNSPPLISEHFFSFRCKIPSRSITASAFSTSSRLGCEKTPIRLLRPSSTISPAVYAAEAFFACGTYAIVRHKSRCGILRISFPSIELRPSFQRKNPIIHRSMVVFPAPLGPSIATSSPSVASRETFCSSCSPFL